MHPNLAFRGTPKERNIAFARERGFGVLAVSAPDAAPLMAHVPFWINEAGDQLDFHLVRSNPIARQIKNPTVARFAVSGPDSYVSPDWYEMPDQVPTWNYVAVHLTGRITPLPHGDLTDVLDKLSAQFEANLLPKPPWTRDKMSAGSYERMLRMIVPYRMQITDVQGTWKLGQNKPDAARHAAGAQIQAFGHGSEVRELAALMQSPFSDPNQE